MPLPSPPLDIALQQLNRWPPSGQAAMAARGYLLRKMGVPHPIRNDDELAPFSAPTRSAACCVQPLCRSCAGAGTPASSTLPGWARPKMRRSPRRCGASAIAACSRSPTANSAPMGGTWATLSSVQKLQMALHAKAKAEADYRLYALYDKISREDILAPAWAQCRSNKGAPGVDAG